ncbi:MAG TPA: hypothetical protein VNV43_05345 [Candidatus Acidoferrales bacterium]|jgi:hypothetical protein|nr:hypothetical protein [Candidatus Acidoferrales bacterium]
MKRQKKTRYPAQKGPAIVLKEGAVADEIVEAPMIRTQIYLNKEEHEFVKREASRRDEPMAAVIRQFIDEKMEIPEDAWINNPMLKPTPHDPSCKGHEDGGINLDHYLYGAPKDYIKVKGKYVEAPPLPDDYYENRASREAYDRKIRELDETK